MDHASLFNETVHRYLPNVCTAIYRIDVYSYLPIIVHCYLPITEGKQGFAQGGFIFFFSCGALVLQKQILLRD